MKKIIIVFLLISISFSCKKEEALPPGEYEIRIVAKGVYDGIRAYLRTEINNKNTRSYATSATDTAIAVNGGVIFKGKVDHSSIQYLTINGVNGNFPMVLEPGITIIEVYKDSIASSKIIKASENNIAYSEYKKKEKEKIMTLNEIRAKMNNARLDGDPKAYQTFYEESLLLDNEINDFPFEFIQTYKNTDFSVLLLDKLAKEKTINDVEKLKNSMIAIGGKLFNKNNYNKTINQKLNILLLKKEAEARVEIGKIAPDFSGITPEGKTINLNDIKGKATIIDFWAAWCEPCRKENPNVVKIYEKFHSAGLEIISISLDGRVGQNNPRAEWLKAIEDDNLNWHHVSNLKYFNDPTVQLYNVKAIPATFILDESGSIVSKRLRGEDLENKIAEILFQ